LQQSIDGLLDLNNLSRRDIVFTEIDLSDIVRKLADDLSKAYPLRSVAFTIASQAPAHGDERLLTLLLENLLDNAWKFTEKSPEAKIEFGTIVLPNQKTAFFIKDNGAGFEMAYAHKLFQPFQRLHAQQDFSGIGIGLASAARIVERHGGSIWAEAEPGKGAVFYFTLPGMDERAGDTT
jgi:light-regulated signal transduction histidine kinase (bacteriophytochrome)